MKRKRYLINRGILAVVFILAVIVFSYVTNKDNSNAMLADMGIASRPQVSFSYNGNEINSLPVYADEMEIPAVRDTITPVQSGKLEMRLKTYDNSIKSLKYTVYTLDGKEKLLENTVEQPQETTVLFLEGKNLLEEERVLEIVLNMEEDSTAYLYTRVVNSAETNISECLNFIRNFHEAALNKEQGSVAETAIEPNEEGDNTTFGHVTINSNYDHVSWGELEPVVEGSELWDIKEVNSIYTSVLLQYRVRCKGEENEEDVYSVREFFRVRHVAEGKKDYLLDYDRTMQQIFDSSAQTLTDGGIILGIEDSETSYLSNKDGTIVSFVQARELWNYNKEKDTLALVFSFADAENTDPRNLFPQHEVKLLQMDNEGNTVFAVYGYMNRGVHEGEVGIAVYYYNAKQNSVEEKVFIASRRSYERVLQELGDLVYYSVDNNVLYALYGGALYEIDVDSVSEMKLAEGLSDSQYVVSDDASLAAYQVEVGESDGGAAVVKDFSTGEERTVKGSADEIICPLGFIKDDFVYGISRNKDAGETVSGQKVTPMYKIVIEDEEGKTVKAYEQGNFYVLGAEFEDTLITLYRAAKDGTTYTGASEDYITNNEKKSVSKIYPELYVTELKETQTRLVCEDGISNLEPEVLEPKQVLRNNSRQVTFDNKDAQEKCYVYGYGRLQGIYDSAGKAIQAADVYSGVVVSERQTYIWQRGNRDLEYSIVGKDEEIAAIRARLNKGEDATDIMQDLSDGKAIDLTGCDAEQLLYVVNQDTPIIAMLDAKDSVVIIGYGDGFVTYKDSAGGREDIVSYGGMNTMTEQSGHTYIGYVK